MRLDWIKTSEKDPDDKVRVHKGFSEQYNAVRNDLWAVVQLRIEEFPDTSEILITGHSLGGALTTMCALDFRLRQSQGQFGGRSEEIKISAYPLAAPRTGNSKFRELFTANVATCDRLVLEKDWIPIKQKQIPRFLRGAHLWTVTVIFLLYLFFFLGEKGKFAA